MAHCPSTGSSPNAQSTTSHETIDTWIYAHPKKMLIEHKLASLRADGGCQSVCVRGLIYKYAVNLSG